MFSQFSKMYIGATRIAHARQGSDAVWDEVAGPAPVAPFWSIQPAISPASGPTGTVFALTEGVAGGTTPLTITAQLLLGTTDVTAQIAVGPGGALTYASTAEGLLSWSEAVSGPGGGPVQSAVAQATVTAPAATTEITFADGISAVIEGAVTTAQHVDGPVQIVSGSAVTILSATPATEGTGASLRNGHVLNPMVVSVTGDPQGYDGRRVNPVDTMAVTFPLTLAPGQILLLTKSSDGAGFAGSPAARCGYTDAAAMIYVSQTAQPAGSLAPCGIGWPGRAELLTPTVVDYAAKAAELPTSFGVTGVTYPTLAQVRRALRFNPFYAQRGATEQNSGYESYFPTGWGQIAPGGSNWNYGQNIVEGLNEILMALIAPTASVSLAIKAEILLRLDSFANQMRQRLAGTGGLIGADGAHQQFIQVACALADWMRGVQPDLANVLGNWGQAYRISDQDVLDAANGYGDPETLSDYAIYPTRMWFHHWRKITAVSGNVLTVETWRNSLITQGDDQYPRWAPSQIVRQSDGATATITSESGLDINNGKTATKTITINAQPGTPFAVGDVIRLRALDAIVSGTADWKERTNRLNSGVPIGGKRYQNQARWGGLMVLRAMGLITPETLIAWDYFVRANLPNVPASDNYPGTIGGSETITAAVYATHMTAITAVAQPYLPAPPVTFYPPVAAMDMAAAAGSVMFPESNNGANAATYTAEKGAYTQDKTGFGLPASSPDPWAVFAIVRLPNDKKILPVGPGIIGLAGSGGNRFSLRFGGQNATTDQEKGRFRVANQGNTGAALTIYSAPWTEDAALVVFSCDGASNYQLDWYSLETGTKFAGAVTKAVGSANNMNGGSATTFAVGANSASAAFSSNGGAPFWPGEIEAVGQIRQAVSEATWAQIALGADILATLGATNLRYLRELDGTAGSLTKPAGATADTTNPLVPFGGNPPTVPVSVQYPGSSFRRQATASYLTMKGLSHGWVYGLVGPNVTRMVPFSGLAGGLNGQTVEVRIVEWATGTVVRDWTAVATVIAGAWSGQIELPKANRWWIAQARCGGVIADRRDLFAVGYKIALVGQSQLNISLGGGAGPATLTNPGSASFVTNEADSYGVRFVKMARIGMEFDYGPMRAFLNTFRFFDANTPIMLLDVAESGTSVMQLIDDSESVRSWSDFQQLLDLYGNDISALVMNWGTTDATSDETENRNRMDAFLFGSGPLAKDHNLTAALQPGFKFAVSPLTRHVYTSMGPTSGVRSAQVGWANDLDYPVGPPVSDMRILNDQGPHQSATVVNGAALMMHRMAIAAARALRLDNSQNPYFTTATRSGATITVGVALPNGGTLYSPLPSALKTFEVSENGGTTWASTGFTAATSGNTVVLTRSTGTWPAGTLVRYSSNLISRTTPTSDSTLEDNIVNSALYETWAGDVVLGRGLPVLGSLASGKWTPNWQATAA